MKILSSAIRRTSRTCRPRTNLSQNSRRCFAKQKADGRTRIPIPLSTPSTSSSEGTPPTVDLCPTPSCACRDTPKDLEIDHTSNMNGSMVAYHEHVIISTGNTNWPSRIEDMNDSVGIFARHLKIRFRPPPRQTGDSGGNFYNVCIW
jgi:hypothetical protein